MARGRVGIDGQLPLVGQVYIRHHMTQATHTLAFQAAINALPAAGGEIILDDMNYTPVVASLTAGARKIRWTGNGTVNGAALWGLPGQQVSFRTALGREIRYQANGAAGEEPPAAPGATVVGAVAIAAAVGSKPVAGPPALRRCGRPVGMAVATASLDSGASARAKLG